MLLVEKILGKYKNSFDLINYKIINEQPAIEGKVASAIVKIRVNGATKIAAADGEGPVHAMDLALRAALADFYPAIARMSLVDFKVRVLDSDKATAAKVRVLITSAGQRGQLDDGRRVGGRDRGELDRPDRLHRLRAHAPRRLNGRRTAADRAPNGREKSGAPRARRQGRLNGRRPGAGRTRKERGAAGAPARPLERTPTGRRTDAKTGAVARPRANTTKTAAKGVAERTSGRTDKTTIGSDIFRGKTAGFPPLF